MRCALRYLGHRSGASLSYFTGASVNLKVDAVFKVPHSGLVIGRRAGAGLRVASSMVAPRHAIVSLHDDGLVVSDLGSTNGTRLNDVDHRRFLSKPGDRITIAGAFDFEVVELPGA
ncbi:MAG: FHA domain-containing protein [Polyangiales bacterium]